MAQYEAVMRVVHTEIWTVEAKDAAEARKKFTDFHESVVHGSLGGEVIDWEIKTIRKLED
jgi:hypothetical protein